MEVTFDSITTLTDEQLFKTLKKYNINCGPITSSTRSIYEKRLKTALLSDLKPSDVLNKKSFKTNDENDMQVSVSRKTRASIAKQHSIEIEPVQVPIMARPVENTLKMLDMNSKADRLERQMESIDSKLTKLVEVQPVVSKEVPRVSNQLERLEREVASISAKLQDDPLRQMTKNTSINRHKTIHGDFDRLPSRPRNDLLDRTSVISLEKSLSRSNSLSTPDKFAARLHNYGLLNNKATNQLEASKILESIATPSRGPIEQRMQATVKSPTTQSTVSRRTAAPTNLYKTSIENNSLDKTFVKNEEQHHQEESSMTNFKFFLFVALFTIVAFYIWLQITGKF